MIERLGERDYALQLWPSRLYAAPVALFTVLWLRFLWRWYALIFLGAAPTSRGFFAMFALPFLLAGVSLLGTSARLCFGRTRIVLDALTLRINDGITGHGAPWPAGLTVPTIEIREFIPESSAHPEPEHDDLHELDAWHVSARLDDGRCAPLCLPVRSLAEANDVATRLNRALARVRTPHGYRDGVSSNVGSDSPLGASIT